MSKIPCSKIDKTKYKTERNKVLLCLQFKNRGIKAERGLEWPFFFNNTVLKIMVKYI